MARGGLRCALIGLERRLGWVAVARLGFPPLEIVTERGGQTFFALPVGVGLIGVGHCSTSLGPSGLTVERRCGHRRASNPTCCRSSVVERILGKAEVVSSILTDSTIFFRYRRPGGLTDVEGETTIPQKSAIS